MSLVN